MKIKSKKNKIVNKIKKAEVKFTDFVKITSKIYQLCWHDFCSIAILSENKGVQNWHRIRLFLKIGGKMLKVGQIILYQQQPYQVIKVTEGYTYIIPVQKQKKIIHTRFHGDKIIETTGRGCYISPNSEVKILKGSS